MHNNTLKPVVMIASAINRFLNNTHVCDDNSIVSTDCLCDSVSFLLRRQISSGRDSVSSTRSRRYEKGSRLVPSLILCIRGYSQHIRQKLNENQYLLPLPSLEWSRND